MTVERPILEVENLSVDIRTAGGTLKAVRDVSFSVGRGETLCLVGESGCGKSVTSLAIMDLLPRAATRRVSRLAFDGVDLARSGKGAVNALRGNRMAMIFQEPMTALNPAYSIGDQLTEGYRRHKKAGAAEARERAVHLLEKVGIAAAGDRLGQYPHQLSGGLRQRIMIAMALMCGPDLVIADEPTTALDVTIQAQILRLLAELQRELGIALVLITHDLGVVGRIADRVAVMYAGEVVENGTAAEIFARPRHPYTQGLMDCIPLPGRTRPGERLGVIPGVVPSLAYKASRSREPWYAGETVIAGIGQGYWIATALQLARGTAAIASDGDLHTLHLAAERRDGFDAPWRAVERPAPTRITDNPAHLRAVQEGMVNTIHGRGTGTRMAIGAEYRMAGKTGTAQRVSRRGSVSTDPRNLPYHLRHQALFVGYAPAENPTIAIAVTVEHGGYGGTTAGPIARKIFDAWLLGKMPEVEIDPVTGAPAAVAAAGPQAVLGPDVAFDTVVDRVRVVPPARLGPGNGGGLR